MLNVSVVIPNYNHAEYLVQRIESVLNQTYQNFEITILDDCSTDNSRDIIEGYRNHPKVTEIVYNSVNTGSPFSQWKKGIETAKCEWVWIAESDDWCEPSLLEELVSGIENNSGCVISYCQSLMIQDNKVVWRSGCDNLEECLPGTEFVMRNMLKGNSIFNASMCIFKKDAYSKVSPEFLTFKFSGDWLFWIEVALTGKVYTSGKTLNYFRKHTNDVSSSAFSSGLMYVEYIPLLQFVLLKYAIISKSDLLSLLCEKQRQFLLDTRVTVTSRKEITIRYKAMLGFKYYYGSLWHLIWILKKNVNATVPSLT